MSLISSISDIFSGRSEQSQGVARVALLFVFAVYFFLANSCLLKLALGYIGISSVWVWWIYVRPSVNFRRSASIVLDHTFISSALWLTGITHVGIFLMYFWVTLGNGYRFGSKFSLVSAIVAIVAFVITSSLSPNWSGEHLVALEFALGFSLISALTYKTLRNLEQAIEHSKHMETKAEQAESRSTTDPLTGLCNREIAVRYLCKAAENNRRVGVLFIDLDNFKEFNDQYGHHVGDEVLITVSKRLKAAIKQNDIACRYAGDEFVVIVNDENPSTIDLVAERIASTLNTTIIANATKLQVTGSIGVAILGIHGDTAKDVLKSADTAMYMAKRAGRNRVAWYEEKIHE